MNKLTNLGLILLFTVISCTSQEIVLKGAESNDSKETEASSSVSNINSEEVRSVTSDKNNIDIGVDEKLKITGKVFLENNSTNSEINWKSSDEKIATVDNSGNIKGVSLGTTTIVLTSIKDSDKKYNVTVNVLDKSKLSSFYETVKNKSYTSSIVSDKGSNSILSLKFNSEGNVADTTLEFERTTSKITVFNGSNKLDTITIDVEKSSNRLSFKTRFTQPNCDSNKLLFEVFDQSGFEENFEFDVFSEVEVCPKKEPTITPGTPQPTPTPDEEES